MPSKLFAEYDPAFGKVVGCHLDVNAVADDRTNAVPPHLAGSIGNDPILVVEHHSEPAVRQNLVDDALDRKEFFFWHER